jgi:transporter family protein
MGFGVSGFFSRLAVDHLSAKSVFVISTIGSLFIVLLLVFSMGFKVEVSGKGVLFSVLGGFLASMGGLCFLQALARGGAITAVSPISAIYPLVTITMAIFLLGEQVTLVKGVGITFALIAVVLLSI